MQRIAFGSVLALALSFASTEAARADDAADMKKLVQAEIKAVMDKQKEADAKDNVMKAKWNNGPYFETADKKYSLRIVARIHLDTNLIDADPSLEGPPPGLGDDFDDATFLRRLRIGLAGDITSYVDYAFNLEFANPNNPTVRDAYITIKNLKECLGCWAPAIRAGQQYEPIGLETVTSDNNGTFVERAGLNSLHPERSIGISFFDYFWHERATAALGFYSTDSRDDASGFAVWDENEADAGWAVTGRFSVVPWAKDTCHFVHLGASASYRKPNTVQYRARPGLGRGPFVADTGVLGLEDLILVNAELGFVWHRLHASAEYTIVNINEPALGDPSFTGWYAQVGYFLTGEARAYDWKKGLWGGTKPCCNFLSNNCCCWGAFEVAARYDVLDLTDATVTGGELSTFMVGFNWYLNPNVRLMFDYVISNIEDRFTAGGAVIVDADVNAFLMRWDIHF